MECLLGMMDERGAFEATGPVFEAPPHIVELLWSPLTLLHQQTKTNVAV